MPLRKGSCDVSVGDDQVDPDAFSWAFVVTEGTWAAPPMGAYLTRQVRFASLYDALSATLDPRASMRSPSGLRVGQRPAPGNAAAQTKQAICTNSPDQRTHGNVSRPCGKVRTHI
jgi:hypothetical protein